MSADESAGLIFDIGLHKGFDTAFYLQKGFTVVGLEASEALCKIALDMNAQYGERFRIINKALYYRSDEEITFYVNDEKDDWGSIWQGSAEKGVGKARPITVKTVTLQDIISEFGRPYYLKCDIEGADTILAEQMVSVSEKPTFVSIEATKLLDLGYLAASGYDRFQLVNQYLNPWTKAPFPSKEGTYVDASFTHEMSGLFGHELPADRWVTYDIAVTALKDWYSVHKAYPSISVGWLDIHACHSSALG